MLIFYRPYTDPHFNIAAEEYFVKQADKDMCMIWTNEQSVIIGKHQNAFAEINYPYVRANHIPVIRRISGGGAVYHDPGNVNFTFIQKTGKTNQVDFGRFTAIIIAFIQSLGIEVNVNKRNSLFVGSLKFSGHAEHIFHDRVLHHGTILFNTDLEALQQSLVSGKEYKGKAMPSARSSVTNIAPLLSVNLNIQQFINQFVTWLLNYYPDSQPYQLQADEIAAINDLSSKKYKTWEWNFGYSPTYTFQVNMPWIESEVQMHIKVENGKIIQVEPLAGNGNQELNALLNQLTGTLHNEEEMDKFIEINKARLELVGLNTVSFRDAFFG